MEPEALLSEQMHVARDRPVPCQAFRLGLGLEHVRGDEIVLGVLWSQSMSGLGHTVHSFEGRLIREGDVSASHLVAGPS